MKTRDDQIQLIGEFIYSKSVITCSKCPTTLGGYTEDDLSEESYGVGWRATKLNIYCPKCVKKFKIRK